VDFGRAWCVNAHAAELAGFNPRLRLEVNEALTVGAARFCHLVLREAPLGRLARLALWRERRARGGRLARPWRDQTRELYAVARELFQERLGQQAAALALQEALADFAERHGEDARDAILAGD